MAAGSEKLDIEFRDSNQPPQKNGVRFNVNIWYKTGKINTRAICFVLKIVLESQIISLFPLHRF